jgi:hypothetical protein
MSEKEINTQRTTAEHHFVGREPLFTWLKTEFIGTDGFGEPFLICGDENSGKTAVLRELARRRLGTPFFPIYFDFTQIATHSLSAALWDIALITNQFFNNALTLTQSKFLGNPLQAFAHQILQPAQKLLQERSLPQPTAKILFLADNFADRFAENHRWPS